MLDPDEREFMTNDGVGFRSTRGPILIALMLTSFLVAIEATVLSTAIPSIVDDLGGFEQFPWLFSVYLLTQAVTLPIYSKLADMVGRKPIILIGIGFFLLGSILSGFADSMLALIIFRAIQGIGAGAVMPIAITISGDIYTVQERAKVQGYLASVWGIAAVIGPTIGGLFAQFDAWRGIFFVNIPLCLLAAWMIMRNYTEKLEKRTHRVDYAGAALVAIAFSALLLAVLEGGRSWAWDSVTSIALFAGGALLLALFVFVESRAAEPIIPLWLFSNRLIVVTTLVSFGVGASLTGLTSYVPLYLQGAAGASPIVAGFALATLTIGWPIAAAVSGRIYLAIGFRATALIGGLLTIAGSTIITVFASTPSVLIVAVASFVIGLGLGLVASPTLIYAQSSVEWNERGVVTGFNLFLRNVGSAVGIAIFGAVANAVFLQAGGDAGEPAAIEAAASSVFLAATIVTVLTFVAIALMPRGLVAPTPQPAADVSPAADGV
jgi:MFS family permease